MRSVNVNLIVKFLGSFWNFNVEEQEVLDFSEESYKYWIEVNSDEFLIWYCSVLSVEKELLELIFSVLFNSTFPGSDLLLIVILEVLAKGAVQLLDVLVFFSILDRLGKGVKLLHWFLDSFKETNSPVQGTRDWWQVA